MRLLKVAGHRAEIRQRIAQQRMGLGMLAQSLERQASLFDKGYILAQKIRRHPKLILGATLLSLVVFRKRLPIVKTSMAVLTFAKWWLSLKTQPLPPSATSNTPT